LKRKCLFEGEMRSAMVKGGMCEVDERLNDRWVGLYY
jgi:hypothetical protein